jgi:SPP1 gp7 family putative phage head morphogenesis protein
MALRLTQKRQTWVQARKAPTIKGDPLHYPYAVMERYQRDLQSLAATMAEDYRRQLRKAWRLYGPVTMDGLTVTADASLASQVRIVLTGLGRKWERVYTDRSRAIADRMVNSASNASMAAVKSSLKQLSGGITLKVPTMPATLTDSVKSSIALNVDLIRDIQTQFAQRVKASVLSAIQNGGQGTAEVFEQLTKIDGMTQRRAKNIADDQVRKVTTSMNTERLKAAGARQFEWLHSSGSADPRELHVEYDGQVFSYDDPPVIDERTGERGFPGQLINCRCVARPVISFDSEAEAA